MISRSGISSSEIGKYLNEAKNGLSGLSKESPKDVIDETLKREGKRLDNFLISRVYEAEKLLKTVLVSELQIYGYSFLPPLPRPVVQIVPPDSYYYRFAPSNLLKHPGFHPSLIVPPNGAVSAIEIEAAFIAPFPSKPQPTLDLEFNIHYELSMAAFTWLFQEWRRPVGQLLRGLPNLELWGNGNPIELPKGMRTKDPAELLEYHLGMHKTPDDNMISLKCSFSAQNTDDDVTITTAVFLCFFDAIFKLSDQRADADRLLSHYQVLSKYLPKAPFRKTAIFSKNDRNAKV